ncbi:MAG TPA: hypothetical protein VF721_16595 [Pyrinomonadaceae bacterium]|jgi:hypothetical protein
MSDNVEQIFEDPVHLIFMASTAHDTAWENYKSNEDKKELLNNLDIARIFYESAFEKLDCENTDDTPINEVACRATLADCHYHLWKNQNTELKVEEHGVQSNSNAFRALTEYEHALLLDFQSGAGDFRRPEIQAQTLLRLSELWMKQSLYLSTAQGLSEAIHYLLIKVRILLSLNTSFPNLCLMLGHYYLQQKDLTNNDDALENGKKWLMRAIHSNDYDDPKFLHDKELAREYYSGLSAH